MNEPAPKPKHEHTLRRRYNSFYGYYITECVFCHFFICDYIGHRPPELKVPKETK